MTVSSMICITHSKTNLNKNKQNYYFIDPSDLRGNERFL